MKKYKYMTIRQENNEVFNDKPVYRIFNNKSSKQIGILSFYKPWKEYIFSTKENCIFNNTCLLDIVDFMDTQKNKEIKKF